MDCSSLLLKPFPDSIDSTFVLGVISDEIGPKVFLVSIEHISQENAGRALDLKRGVIVHRTVTLGIKNVSDGIIQDQISKKIRKAFQSGFVGEQVVPLALVDHRGVRLGKSPDGIANSLEPIESFGVAAIGEEEYLP